MTRRDFAVIAGLAVLAAFVWVRDRAWLTAPAEALPVLAALPLFVWLGAPWRRRAGFRGGTSWPLPPLLAAGVGFAAGIATNLTVLLALGWTALLWAWLSQRVVPEALPAVRRLLVLPVLAFPWIILDCQAVGWWFRLSGAWVTGKAFGLLQFDVVQDGTNLQVQGLPISVEAACSGLNTLQAMLIAGSVLAFIVLGRQPHYWWNLPLLVLVAWGANTLRILTLCAAGLTFSPKFAQGFFHTWGGWLVLMLMFLLCWPLFAAQRRAPSPASSAA
jgi:exosortase